MRVGIIGDAKRAVAWETHLRPVSSVSEVVIAPTLKSAGQIDACFLIDETDENLQHLIKAIRLGIHTFLISRLPADKSQLQKVYHSSQEADVRIQFSHWPTISPSVHWMQQQLPKPDFIQVVRKTSYINYTENKRMYHHNWVDELALITKWLDMTTQHIEAYEMMGNQSNAGIRIHLSYDSGASASIFYLSVGDENYHQRLISGKHIILDLDVIKQQARKLIPSQDEHFSVEKRSFDASKTAELAAVHFFKAIQTKRSTLFTPYDALNTATMAEKVEKLIRRP